MTLFCILIGLLIHVVMLPLASKGDRPCSPVIYNISSSTYVPCMALQTSLGIEECLESMAQLQLREQGPSPLIYKHL